MEKTRLSNSLIVAKIVLSIFFVIFLVKIVQAFELQEFLICIFVFTGIAYFLFYLPDTIEFDNEYMYIKGKNDLRTVYLKDVQGIASTGLSLNYSMNLFKIQYSYKDTASIAKFYPKLFYKDLNKFRNAVLAKNPNAKANMFWPF